MSRNRHFRDDRDHQGFDRTANVKLSADTTSYLEDDVLQDVLEDLDVRASAGFAPVVGFAECNAAPTTHATPNAQTNIPFDTFYNAQVSTIGDLTSLGLGVSTVSGGTLFTALEAGVWIVSIGASMVVAPGSTGNLVLAVPDNGFSPTFHSAAAGNPIEWITERTLFMGIGDTFKLRQDSTGSSVQIVDDYMILNIVRIASSFS